MQTQLFNIKLNVSKTTFYNFKIRLFTYSAIFYHLFYYHADLI